MFIRIKEHLKSLIKNELKSSKWKENDEFYLMRNLSIDQRGRVGEHLLRDVFTELNYKVHYVDNDHGDYDIKVEKFKIEVKTATLDVNNNFQHEGVKNSRLWDFVCFVDIAPNNLFITFVPRKNFTFSKTNGKVVFNGFTRNIHFRGKDNTNKRATGAGYKVDFKLNQLEEVKTIKDFEDLWKKAIKSK